jgi:hypothetical protein
VLKYVLFAMASVTIVFTGVGCSKMKGVKKVTSVVVKDIPIEQQLALLEKYQGRHAWTRDAVEDLTERVDSPSEPRKRVVPRDTKVTILDLNLVYTGSVTVDDPKGRRIVAALNCEQPLTPEKVEAKLDELFWFDDPVIRHVAYIRKWGKKAARSVINHEVFAGMPAEAARESWGIPDEIRVSEIGTEKEEQWVYKLGKRNKYIYIVGNVVGRYEE